MNVGTTTWQLAGVGNDAKIIAQNVGVTRIAFVIAAAQPAPNAIVLDSDGHGIFGPGEPPFTISGMDMDTTNLYVRALGPKNGKLYVVAS